MTLTTTVLVGCDYSDDDDYCEAEFEVWRNDLPAAVDLHMSVNEQLALRGWSGSTSSKLICPLHQRDDAR